MEKLRFIQVTDPNIFKIIPKHLLKNERVCEYGLSVLTVLVPNNEGQMERRPNPLVHIAIFIDEKGFIKGYLWAEFDIVERSVFIQELSADSEYKDVMLEQVQDYIFDLPINPEYKSKIQIISDEDLEGWQKVGTLFEKENNNGIL